MPALLEYSMEVTGGEAWNQKAEARRGYALRP
jgi:hypothetical protein